MTKPKAARAKAARAKAAKAAKAKVTTAPVASTQTAKTQSGTIAGRIWFPQVIRAVACLVVVFEHLGSFYPRSLQSTAAIAHFKPPKENSIQTPWTALADLTDSPHFSMGFMAVAMFFLVSGFVIPLSLRTTSAAEFTSKRVFRLYPTLAACTLVTVFVFQLQAHFLGVVQPHGVKTTLMTMTLTAPFLNGTFVDPVMWTLVVEEIFYFTTALMVWRNWQGKQFPLCAIGIVIVAIAALPASDGSALFFAGNFGAFVPLVFVGTAIYHWYSGQWARDDAVRVGGCLFACFAAAMYLSGNNGHVSAYVLASVAAVGAFLGLIRLGPRLPYSRLLDRLSEITYPLYLLHYMCGVILLNWLATKDVSYFIALPVTIAAVVVGAIAIHLLIEEPMVKVGHRVARVVRARRSARAAAPLNVRG